MAKKNHNTKVKTKQNKASSKDIVSTSFLEGVDKKHCLLVTVLALVSGYLSCQHISSMFEGQKHFSHLSTLERELSFRTEMGLYYSYYKTIAEAPSYVNGVSSVLSCNITEYPDRINVLRRFNLYPELVLGTLFRMYTWFGDVMGFRLQMCYTINRGKGFSQVQSCEGMGDIAHFYVFPIFWLSGFQMAMFFVLGSYLSGNVLGGIVSVTAFFYNFGEATRVMWTPPLRESFSFPFLVAQLLYVVHLLKCHAPTLKHSIYLSLITTCFMLPWQFAQFALLTQVCALFGLYILKFIDSKRILVILYGLLLAHAMNFVAQFANTLLISSFFMAAMFATLIIVKLEERLEMLPNRVLIWITQALLFVGISIVIKVGSAKIFQIKDDAHIFDILKLKFSDFKDFHTLLYVCAPEFDFIGWEYFNKVNKTLLLPASCFVALVLIIKLARNEWRYWIRGENLSEESAESSIKPYTEHLYLFLQTVAFMIMSVMIMRLKLFGTPALCLLASLVASRQIFGFVGHKNIQYSIVCLLLAGMSVHGWANLSKQFNTQGSYSNPDLEQAVEWINANTHPGAVFAGSMPTMANIKLSTGRPIVNHPHYEDSGLRARTKRVYQIFSRKDAHYYHEELKDMGVTYVILEPSWCNKSTRKGCSLPEVWDIEDPDNMDKPAMCNVLLKDARPFKRVWNNKVYYILKV